MMKAFLIAAIVLFAVVSAAPETDPSKLRGLIAKDENRELSGILNIDLAARIASLVKVIVNVDVTSRASVTACIQACNLLKAYLNIVIGGNSCSLIHIDANLKLADLLAIIAKIDVLKYETCCQALLACDQIITLCNGLLVSLPNLIGLINLGSLLNLNLAADIASLVQAIVHVDFKNRVDIQACIRVCNLLKVYLNIVIGGNSCSLIHIDANLALADLLAIIAKIDVLKYETCCRAIQACDQLIALCNGILAGRNLGGILDLGGLLNIDLTLDVLHLVNVVLVVDVNNLLSVQSCLRSLLSLRLQLNVLLLQCGGAPANLVAIDANLTIAQLLVIIAQVRVGGVLSHDPVVVAHCLQACEALIPKLKAIKH